MGYDDDIDEQNPRIKPSPNGGFWYTLPGMMQNDP